MSIPGLNGNEETDIIEWTTTALQHKDKEEHLYLYQNRNLPTEEELDFSPQPDLRRFISKRFRFK